MNREIKFRGKQSFDNKWIHGSLLKDKKKYYITNDYGDTFYAVIPETIGQFTGLYDKNGVEIYEGDVLNNTAVNFKFIVKFENTKYILQKLEYPDDALDMNDYFHRIPTMFEVIGNIYEREVTNAKD